jgi:ketosteroid isomerase-like protein
MVSGPLDKRLEEAKIGVIVGKRKVAGAFEALNQRDLPKFMSGWADDAVYVYPGESRVSGTFTGKAAVEDWFREFLAQFPTFHFDVQEIKAKSMLDFLGTNVFTARWNMPFTNRDGLSDQENGVTVLHTKRGKVFLDEESRENLGESHNLWWGVT